jgi:syndecan 1
VALLRALLVDGAPRELMVSTPNYESNAAVRAAARGAPTPPTIPPTGGGGSGRGEALPEPYRETDHKFEWTRAQFRAWAEGGAAAAAVGAGGCYRVDHVELGARLPGMAGPDGCGGATQVRPYLDPI